MVNLLQIKIVKQVICNLLYNFQNIFSQNFNTKKNSAQIKWEKSFILLKKIILLECID